jgi:predicted RNA-binding Zn ribbon-like protein
VPATAPSDAVQVVRDFINTAEPQVGGDDLVTAERVRDWFAGRGMVRPDALFSSSDVETLRTVREGLRTVLLAHAGHAADPAALERLDAVLAALPIRPSLNEAGYQLVSTSDAALSRAAAGLLDAIRRSIEEQTWPRLKVCARDTCRWAFYDESRNQVRRWCSMAGCGNHVKMRRAYATRKRRAGDE